MYYIQKEFRFSASHQLDDLPDDHQCARLHGHNYRVLLHLASPTLDEVGFVVDFGDLVKFREFLDVQFDHQHLNDRVPNGMNPTAENLARYLYEVASRLWPQTRAVGVEETLTSYAEYRP